MLKPLQAPAILSLFRRMPIRNVGIPARPLVVFAWSSVADARPPAARKPKLSREQIAEKLRAANARKAEERHDKAASTGPA